MRLRPSGHAVSGQPLSEQADAAWKAGNYAEAERLYNVVARDVALPTDQARAGVGACGSGGPFQRQHAGAQNA